MSHYIGLVFVNREKALDIESMLEPYDEQTENPLYLDFVDQTEEVRDTFEKMPDSCPSEGTYTRRIDETDLVNKIWEEAPDELDEEQEGAFWKPYNKKDYPTPADIARDKEWDIIPDETKPNGVRFERSYEASWSCEPSKEKYPTMDALATEYFGYKKKGKKYGYIHNPRAKWDWYCDGGRWDGYLVNKDGKKTNEELITEVDWEKTDTPFCFVDTDGEWIERGEMGWFAMVANEKKATDWNGEFKAYVDSLLESENAGEIEVYAIDFHI